MLSGETLSQDRQQAGVDAPSHLRRLLDNGLTSKRAAKRPFPTKKSIKDRLEIGRKHKDWVVEVWCKVSFFDDAPRPVS